MLLCLGSFSSEFHVFRYKRDSLAIADKKIEVNFIHSYDILFNLQPTTVEVLNNFTSILEPTYQNKLWCDPFQKEKQKTEIKIS